jgi:hypothetical protein
MANFILFGRDSEAQEIQKYFSSLNEVALYTLQLKEIHFAKLWIKDRDRDQMIRWDLFMNPTWHDSTSDSSDLLTDWFQCLSNVAAQVIKVSS